MEVTKILHKKKSLAPKVRFSGFNESWLSIELNSCISLVSGFPFQSELFSENGSKLITPKNFTKTGKAFFDKRNTKFSTEIVDSKYICKSGDLLVLLTDLTPTCELLGKPVLLNETDGEVLLNQRIVKVIEDEKIINKPFLSNIFQTDTYHKRIKETSSGTTVRHSSNRVLLTYKTPIPSLREQQKIASFLSAVDEKIQQLNRKKELLEQYKKGVMRELFSYKKRLYSSNKLRKGTIKDFGYFYYGKSAPKFSVTKTAKTPCVRYGELYSTYKSVVKKIVSYTEIEPSNLKFSKGGEVLVPRVGEDPLDFANCCFLPFKDVAIGEMISVYNTNEDGLFMTYYFNIMLRKKFARVVEGGNVSNLYFKYLENVEIVIPPIEEQKKVALFISKLENKLENLNKQITQTQTFKKGLLQQMFV